MSTILLLSYTLTSFAGAQAFYPLAIGNRWDYRTDGYAPPPDPPQSVHDSFSVIVVDTIRIRGELWYQLNRPDLSAAAVFGSRYVQSDSLRVRYLSERDSSIYTLYRFDKTVGDRWELGGPSSPFVECFSRDTGIYFGLPAERCAYRYQGLLTTEVTLAKSLGIVYKFYAGEPPGTWHQEWFLKGCILVGSKLGVLLEANSAAAVPSPSALAVNVYPNPAHGRITVTCDLPATSSVQLELFDALGRPAAEWTQRDVPVGPREITWMHGVTRAGFYLLRINAGNRTASSRVLLVR
jgi:hypothetical protein